MSDKEYQSLSKAETGGEKNPWIRTKAQPPGGSTAFGPVQITMGKALDYVKRADQTGLSQESIDFVNKTLIPMFDNFKKYGREPNKPGYKPEYDYGGTGFFKEEDKAKYQKLANEMIRYDLNKVGGNQDAFLKTWRGQQPEKRYRDSYMEEYKRLEFPKQSRLDEFINFINPMQISTAEAGEINPPTTGRLDEISAWDKFLTSNVGNKVVDILSGGMTLTEAEALQKQEIQSLVNLPGQVANVGKLILKMGIPRTMPMMTTFSGLVPLITKDDIENLANVAGTFLKPISRPFTAVQGGVGSALKNKSVEEIANATLKGFLKPEEVDPIQRQLNPIKAGESNFSIGLRAVGEAFETLALSSVIYGGGIEKIRNSIRLAGQKNTIRVVEKDVVPILEKNGIKFPSGLSGEDKAIMVVQSAKDNVNVAKVIQKALADQPVSFLRSEAGAIRAIGVGDYVKSGKEIAQVIKIEGPKAILSLAGKELSRNVADLEVVSPQPQGEGIKLTPEEQPVAEAIKKGMSEEEFVKDYLNKSNIGLQGKFEKIPLNKIQGTDYSELDKALSENRKLSIKEAEEIASPTDEYKIGQDVKYPIEVIKNEDGSYSLMAGNHRLIQKLINGEKEVYASIQNEKSYSTKEQINTLYRQVKKKMGQANTGKIPPHPKPTAVSPGEEEEGTGFISEKKTPSIVPTKKTQGVKRLQAKVEKLTEQQVNAKIAKDTIEEVDYIRKQFKNRINKYKGGNLSEELSGLPKYYVKSEGGISPDEAMSELRDQHGIDLNNETDLVEYLKGLDEHKKNLVAQSKSGVEMINIKESTLAKKELKAAEVARKQGITEGKKIEAEHRKQAYFGSEITKEQRRELYVVALKKGVIYTDYSGKTHDKLQGIIRYYKGASFDQIKDYLSSLSGDPQNPPRLFKLYGDIDKDAEAMQEINKVKENWQDINPVEVNTLDPARIVEKVSGQDLWDDNVFADNTFNVISSADEAMFDRKQLENTALEKGKQGISAGSKESAELMRKFETKEPLTDKEQQVVNFLRAKYDALITEMNANRELLDKKPIPYRQDYMTHIVEQNLLDDFFQNNRGAEKISSSQMDAIRMGDYTKGNMPFNRFAQQRLGNKTKYDAIGNYLKYLNTAMKEIYYAPAISHVRKFIEYALDNQPNAFKAMDRMLNDLKGKPSIADQNAIGVIASSKPIKWLRTHISRSALVGNINFWAMNLSNFSTSYGELGNYVNIGMAKFLGNKEWRQFAFKNSKMLKGRAIDPDFIDQPIHTKLEEVVGSVTNLIEYNNIGTTFVGAYFKGIDEGMTQEKAIEYADDIARRTQVGYKPYEVNAWMRSNSGKLLSQFQTWSFNAMNHILYDLGTANIPGDIKSMFTDTKTNRTRWGAFLTLVATSIMVNALYRKMGLREPYQPTAAMPSISPLTSAGKFGDIGPVRIARDIGSAVTSKKLETRKKATQRVVGSVIPGGAQAVRFMQGNVFPEKDKKKKITIK